VAARRRASCLLLQACAGPGQGELDSHAYCITGHVADLYRDGPRREGAYLYSPAFAQAISPLTSLPWRAFAVWLVLELAALVWLVAPLRLPWAVVVFFLAASCWQP
jgi:hypothetical protein